MSLRLVSNFKSQTYPVVMTWDPAIDIKESDTKAYSETLELSHLKFKPGQEPTTVWLKNISGLTYQTRIVPYSFTMETKYLYLLQFGIDRIENIKPETVFVKDLDYSNILPVWRPSKTYSEDGENQSTMIDINDVCNFFNKTAIKFIGSILEKKTASVK